MNILERWLARRDPRRRQPFETRATWQTRRLAERSNEHHPELSPAVYPQSMHGIEVAEDPPRNGPLSAVRLVRN